MLVAKDGGRCDVCTFHRPYLYTLKKRQENAKSLSPTELLSSTIRNDRLPGTSDRDKLKAITGMVRQLKRKAQGLEEKIQRYIEDSGQRLSENMEKSFSAIMEQHDSKVTLDFPSGSPQLLLWQQKAIAAKKGPSGMRWHPAILRWCIALHARSPAAYRMIRGSKFLVLPHENTLRDYTLFTKSSTGINKDIINRIKDDIGFSNLADFQEDVSLVFDEMKIRSGLVYSSSDGKLVGFCELGDIVASIDTFVGGLGRESESPDGSTSSPSEQPALPELKPATHVLALMMRGIFSPLAAVFAFYPCIGFTSYQLYPVVWKAIGVLESAGFRVRSVVSDGASPNRKFYRMHVVPGYITLVTDGGGLEGYSSFAMPHT